jgi:RimJ/RimL family protein N-acetyltransferase
VFGLLEGKNVNLRIQEKEDLPLIAEWINDPEFMGEYDIIQQVSKTELEKRITSAPPELKSFLIEKKDETKIGAIACVPKGSIFEINYGLISGERNKGYGTEAIKIIVDYIFLSKDTVRVQAHTDVRNEASQKVLQKVGFKKEGIVRKGFFIRGEWRDCCLYSILREEWKEPKILTKTT